MRTSRPEPTPEETLAAFVAVAWPIAERIVRGEAERKAKDARKERSA